ncbi:MAG: PKD domain-containing protein [Lentimicrobium sp.]
MKTIYKVLLTVILTGFTMRGYSQIQQGGIPYSFEHQEINGGVVPVKVMPGIDLERLQAEDAVNDLRKDIPWRFGENMFVNFNTSNSGVWKYLENGDKLWRLSIQCPGAFTINLTFDRYVLPAGARLFVYNADQSQVIGAFTEINNQEDFEFATTLIPGDQITIEYFEPAIVAFPGELSLYRVTHGYRDAFDFAKSFGSSGSCNNNVACPEAAGWENEIKSSCMLVTGGSGFCSGSLVNNTNNNGTPYILTADHCYSSPGSWVFWFNWQSATCSNPASSPSYNSLSGATLKARNADSDFCLVQINSTPPSNYNVYYSGWNRENTASTSSVGIHHPSGDIKKISFDNNPTTSSDYEPAPYLANSHWKITQWDDGTTEGGSSGSPLYDQNHRIIGQLHGGWASCTSLTADFYGKFSMSWDRGTTAATRLKDWLDPTNTSGLTLNGYDPNVTTGPPVANFSASSTSPAQNSQVNFTDQSSNNPTSWSWSFSPSTITYLNSTTSSTRNPQVSFNQTGYYTVTLTATNAYGSDSEIKTNYINVISCNFNTLPFTENFSGGALPSCWTIVDNQGNGQVWQFGSVSGISLNAPYAYLNSDSYGQTNTQNADLVTPTLNLSAYTNVTLQFNHYFRSYTGSSGTLSYSINNGSSWTTIQTYTTSTANPAAFSQVIAPVAGQAQVKFKWNYTGTWGYYWAVDDINISGSCSTTYPVSVTIAPSANNICAGTPVTFTATPTNGGTPSYQWYRNAAAVGSNQNTYTYTPANNDQVYVRMTSSLGCVSGNPANSAITTMIVNPVLPVSVAVSPSANNICAGTPVTFTAAPSNGGTTPDYQWKVNGTDAGTNSATYAYAPANGDVVTCVLTSNLACTSGNPATSAPVTITVNPLLPVSVSVSPSANNICAGTPVTFTAAPSNGGTTPDYQWKVNGTDAGTNSATYAYAPANGDVVTCVLTSNLACTSGNPATSAPVNMTVNPLLPVSVAVSPSANNICAGTPVTFTATPTNGGTTPSYQWKVNGTDAGTNSATYAYAPANGDVVTCVLTSILACTSGNPATSAPVTMTVNPLLPVSVAVSPSANNICAGTPVTFTATPTNGGTTPSYQWKVNGTDAGTNSATYAYAPANGDVVTCVLTSILACTSGNPATSAPVTITVNPLLPVSVAVSPSANNICAGTPVTLTATPTNGGTTPSYQWKVNGTDAGTNSATYAYAPANGDVVTCDLTSDEACNTGNPATSAPVTMTVNPLLPVSVAVSPSANNICAGTPVTFTATPTNGGTTPSYQWKVNGTNAGTNSATYAYAPANSDAVTCVLTSNLACTSGNPATSAPVTMTVNPLLPVSVAVSPSANNICAGTPVTFTATPTNGGTTPSYQWKVNGTDAGTNSATYAYAPANGDVVTCDLTSDEACNTGNPATSAPVTMTVNPLLPVSVAVSPSANNICAGTPVTFTATPTNGGTTPSYQWKVNGTDAGTNSATYAYAPANGDVVTCDLTSDEACNTGNPATSAPVTMTVNPLLPVSVAVSPSDNNICAGTPVTFTATPTNGGTTPSYQWKVNGTDAGTNSATYAYAPANGDVVTCDLTSDEACNTGNPATSAPVTITVNPLLPVSVAVSPSANNICAGTPVTFTATPTNGGTTPDYQWKVNGTDAGTNSATYAYAPANGDVVTCDLTSDEACNTGNPATSAPVTMTVNPLLPVSVFVSPSANNICAGTPVTFTATPTNGGTTPSYQWKVNGTDAGTNSATYAYAPANGDVVTCDLTSDEACNTGNPATSAPVTMTVNPLLPVSVSVSPSANNICAGTPVTFTATPTNGGTTPDYQWKVNGTDAGTNSATYAYAPANGDVVTCDLTSDEACNTGNPATSAPVTMTVNAFATVGIEIIASDNPVLTGTLVEFTATGTNGGSTPVYQWQLNGSDVGSNNSSYAYFPVDGDVIGCSLTSDLLCANGNPAVSNQITMIVQPLVLIVAPVNFDVPASVGVANFEVTSNTLWSVESDQTWCVVTPSGSGNGVITANYSANSSGFPRSANITVTASGLTPSVVTITQSSAIDKVLNLTLYLEGLFNGTGMNKVQGNTGDQYPGTIADQITVELHHATSPYNLAGGPYTVGINTDGSASITVPAALGDTYYIVVKHRNSIETWNASPVSFSAASLNYNFSSSADQALGSNLKLVAGKYLIFGGDVNQDGVIDTGDFSQVDNDAANFISGYSTSDVNGDGVMNFDDIDLIKNNASIFVVKVLP